MHSWVCIFARQKNVTPSVQLGSSTVKCTPEKFHFAHSLMREASAWLAWLFPSLLSVLLTASHAAWLCPPALHSCVAAFSVHKKPCARSPGNGSFAAPLSAHHRCVSELCLLFFSPKEPQAIAHCLFAQVYCSSYTHRGNKAEPATSRGLLLAQLRLLLRQVSMSQAFAVHPT